MQKKDVVLSKLENLAMDYDKITLPELHGLLRRCDVISTHYRKDFIMWLEATGRIEVMGNVVRLIKNTAKD